MTLRFERSTDYELIAAILTNSQIYRRMTNDAAPEPEDLFVGPVAGITYVVGFEGNVPVALFLLAGNRYAAGISECHFAMSPAEWGRTGEIAAGFLQWVWRETSIYKLIGPLPSYNRLALRLARAVGFKEYDVQRNAGTRNGIQFDLMYTEIRRPVAQGAGA